MYRIRYVLPSQDLDCMENYKINSFLSLSIKIKICICMYFTGLLFRFDSKRFNSIPKTIKEKQSTQTGNVDNVFSCSTWARRFGPTIFTFILQCNNTPVSKFSQLLLFGSICYTLKYELLHSCVILDSIAYKSN